ncbi:hypothetical protein B0J13DRAFT_433981 [Dactylonectria estremocensis]|uniref:Arrestin-like N-terminal domain-containing protein n=1 Tax=Dactylonectria estremocensis TaxID=1079267 RepID=A0A9P9FDE4_9HYPO|nr:hypothetical protein B0J13DRAFT_433981 [Dactylonectria estremocensis]
MAHLSPDSGPHASRPRSGRTGLDITIENHWSSKAYTSGSTINGHVVVNSQRDVAFDDMEIQFTGTAYTRVDFVNQYATYASRPFLKLRMPIRAADFPNPRVFQAGRTYTIPFHFVVPHQLTLSACSHHVENSAVRDAHLRLPPTMGLWEVNDLSPEMAQIEYSIHAAVFRDSAEHGRMMALEGFHLVKVLPSLPEDAPLEISAKDERYQLSKTKAIRKNIFSAKQGKLSATAVQPSAVMLSADGLRASESLLRINLDFDPASAEAAPPKINSVTTKLQATTFFSNAPMSHLPNMGARINFQSSPCLTYSNSTVIPISPVQTPTWEKDHLSQRRDSGYSSSAWPESDSDSQNHSSASAKSANRLVSALNIPFTLPMGQKKFFLPSFQSCISGRSYFLQVTLSVGPSNTNFNLVVPLQIGVENVYDLPQGDLPSFESAMAEAEQEAAEYHLQPRLMSIPSAQYQQTSTLPGYEEMQRRTVAAA